MAPASSTEGSTVDTQTGGGIPPLLRVIILEAEAAKKAEDAILTRHRIPSPHSPDLFDRKEDTQVV